MIINQLVMKQYDFSKVVDRKGSGSIKVDGVKKVFGKELVM